MSTFSLISLFLLQYTFKMHHIAYLCWKCRETPINQSACATDWPRPGRCRLSTAENRTNASFWEYTYENFQL